MASTLLQKKKTTRSDLNDPILRLSIKLIETECYRPKDGWMGRWDRRKHSPVDPRCCGHWVFVKGI